MDVQVIAMTARALERILGVLAALLAIYCGYKLFALLPATQNDSSGKLELPAFKIVFARVGPGLLFAALGAAVIAASLKSQLSLAGEALGGKTSSQYSVSDVGGDKLSLAEQLMEISCAGEVLASPKVRYPRPIAPSLEAARVALLLLNWHSEWGNPDMFRRWTRDPSVMGVHDEVKSLYFQRREKCPD
jgi:hypothetical protein